MIDEMKASLEQLAAEIQAVDSSYTSAKARDYIGFSEDTTGFADRVGLSGSLLCAALILLLAFVCVFMRIFLSDKEKEI